MSIMTTWIFACWYAQAWSLFKNQSAWSLFQSWWLQSSIMLTCGLSYQYKLIKRACCTVHHKCQLHFLSMDTPSHDGYCFYCGQSDLTQWSLRGALSGIFISMDCSSHLQYCLNPMHQDKSHIQEVVREFRAFVESIFDGNDIEWRYSFDSELCEVC